MSRIATQSCRMWCLLGAVICAAMIGVAYYLQHGLGLEPCPLCIFQRIAVMAAGIAFLPGIFYRPQRTGVIWGGLALIASLVGMGLAGRHMWLQSLPPDQVPTCGPGLDYMLEVLPFWSVLKQVLSGSGECAQIEGIFMGITLPGWTMMGLVVVGAVALGALVSALRRK